MQATWPRCCSAQPMPTSIVMMQDCMWLKIIMHPPTHPSIHSVHCIWHFRSIWCSHKSFTASKTSTILSLQVHPSIQLSAIMVIRFVEECFHSTTYPSPTSCTSHPAIYITILLSVISSIPTHLSSTPNISKRATQSLFRWSPHEVLLISNNRPLQTRLSPSATIPTPDTTSQHKPDQGTSKRYRGSEIDISFTLDPFWVVDWALVLYGCSP